jgi:thioesterase domain-containing protein
MRVEIETLAESMTDEHILLQAVTVALALERAGKEVSIAGIVDAAEQIPGWAATAALRERLPGLSETFADLDRFSSSLAKLLSSSSR